MKLPSPYLSWPISYEAVCEIARSEGCKLVAYLCQAGVATIGFGRTKGVNLGDTCTQAEADRWLCEDLTEFCEGVKARLTRAPSKNELGAMVSLAYNIGLGGFAKSTVLRQFNAGDKLAASRAFGLWNKVTINGKKQVSKGLTSRRAREAALFLTPDEGDFDEVPQRVEPESTLVQSPIAQSGIVSIAGGTVAAVAAIADPVREVADSLSVNPMFVVALVALVVGGVVIYQRIKQRQGGWA